jgi:biofilm regulator BssS
MNSDPAFPAFPVTDWQIGSSEEKSSLVIKFGYSTSPYGTTASTFDSQFFALTPEKARSLIHDLELYAKQCE